MDEDNGNRDKPVVARLDAVEATLIRNAEHNSEEHNDIVARVRVIERALFGRTLDRLDRPAGPQPSDIIDMPSEPQ